MSVANKIYRCMMIWKLLIQRDYVTVKDMKNYLYKQSGKLLEEIDCSDKTIKRDIRDLENIVSVSIEYSFSERGYRITGGDKKQNMFNRMIDEFEMFNILNLADDNKNYIFNENREKQRIENLPKLLNSIKNRKKIRITYVEFWNGYPETFLEEPIAIKEYRNRWYILVDQKDDIKRYSFDRISHIEYTKIPFSGETNFIVEKYFENCFGIIGNEGRELQKIVLSFEPYQGNYLKTLKLHNTQKVLVDNEEEFRIELKLYVTYDFVKEVLSYGDTVKVIEPQNLIDLINTKTSACLEQYN